MDNRIIELLVKKKLGTLSLSEHTELGKITSEKENLDNFCNTLDEFWDNPLTYTTGNGNRVEESLVRVNKKITKQSQQQTNVVTKIIKWPKLIAVAAALTAIVTFSIFYLNRTEVGFERPNTIVTHKGSKSMVILPDGSKVWINNDSKITYGKSFGKGTRELTLLGEAYFDIVKDKTRPFIVHTKTADIKVLGTVFNVRAYAGDNNLETTLLRGAVEVNINGEEAQKILLKPNEKVIIKTNTSKNKASLLQADEPKIVLMNIKRSVQDSNMVKETQWVENRLVFEQEKLSDIAVVLERWYNVKIEIKVPEVMDKRISGTYEDKSIGDILESIQAVTGLKYKIHNNTISIYK